MNEATFSKQFRDDYKVWYPESFVQLIVDAPRSHKKPYDCLVVNKSIPIAVEFKFSKGNTFVLSGVKEHQIYSLKQFECAGGVSYVVIYIQGLKLVFAYEVSIHDEITEVLFANNHKSISEKNIDLLCERFNDCAVITRGKVQHLGNKTFWDIGKFEQLIYGTVK